MVISTRFGAKAALAPLFVPESGIYIVGPAAGDGNIAVLDTRTIADG